jgi:hypothetical protein
MDICLSLRRTSDIESTAVILGLKEPEERDRAGSRDKVARANHFHSGLFTQAANLPTLWALHICVFLFYQSLDTASLAKRLVQELHLQNLSISLGT